MLSEREMLELLASVAVGIGDDAAVLAGGLVLASDMLVEGVHFRRHRLDAHAIGQRAGGANLSDMAAMGAEPIALVAAFGLPAGFEEVDRLAAGIVSHGVPLVGGDLSRSERLVVSIAALGRAEQPLLRSGGHAGDVLWVTGQLGGQAASGYTSPVRPRLAEGLALRGVASAMIDLSDGIGSDAARLADASGCGALVELERLPLAAGADIRQAAAGGEDYELLAALPAGAEPPVPMTAVGWLTPQPGTRLVDGAGAQLDLAGWEHFA
jgi:thiamine-monophosphate kinase